MKVPRAEKKSIKGCVLYRSYATLSSTLFLATAIGQVAHIVHAKRTKKKKALKQAFILSESLALGNPDSTGDKNLTFSIKL